MKRFIVSFYLLLCFSTALSQNTGRERPFTNEWSFVKDSTIDASAITFNDASWRLIDLPHDWSIEDLPDQQSPSIVGPFHKKSPGQGATGYTVGGTGWYRKKFKSEKSFEKKIVRIHFDGVYMNSDVWLNGHHLGNHPYGYTPFQYDLTPYLNPAGEENIIAVRVRNAGRNSRWYSGSGIYRDVWLTVKDRVHLEPWGVFVTTSSINKKTASVKIVSDLKNQHNRTQRITLRNTIYSPDGQEIISTETDATIQQQSSVSQTHQLIVKEPNLWSVETPVLYKLVTEITQGKQVMDRTETFFGIRSVHFSAENGFELNGERILLKGGCIHHDNGPLGAAVYYRAEERKIEILKRNGFNAVRTSHNPPSKELLAACDRLGVLVIDEAFDMWEKPKNPADYHLYFDNSWQADLDAMVLRDRNHPSVICWSIGNEIKERVDSSGLRITKQLVDRVHQLDPTRPVTEALCIFWDNPGYQWEATAAAFALLDVGGYNYLYSQYEKDHQSFPQRVMMGTESFPQQALENWNMVEKHSYVVGDFVWTAFDYIGEAAIGHTTLDSTKNLKMTLDWPWFNGYCGDIDLIGNKKPQSYYRDVVWRNKAISMAVHAPIPEGLVENVSFWGWPDEQQSWTWPEATGESLQVRVFSRAPSIRLLLNGRVIEEKKVNADQLGATFTVPYEPGVLRAINIIDGKKSDSVELKTAGNATSIRLIADRERIQKNKDLSFITVEAVDANGEVVPNASLLMHFSVIGSGTIAGVGNGSPTEMKSFQKPECKTWRGRCLSILRSGREPGTIVFKATSEGLTPAEIIINVE